MVSSGLSLSQLYICQAAPRAEVVNYSLAHACLQQLRRTVRVVALCACVRQCVCVRACACGYISGNNPDHVSTLPLTRRTLRAAIAA